MGMLVQMLAKPFCVLSPGWSKPWGHPPCWGSLGSAWPPCDRLQGMNSTRHMYHITEHSSLQLNDAEAMTPVQKAQRWHCGRRWHREQTGAWGNNFTCCQGVSAAFTSRTSPSSTSNQSYLHAGPQYGQGRTAAHILLPHSPNQNTPRNTPSKACLFFNLLALIWLYGLGGPQYKSFLLCICSAQHCLVVTNTEIQKCRGENQSQHISIQACFSSRKNASRPL